MLEPKKELTSLEKMRHSTAHTLAMAVLEIFPAAKLGIGPVIEDGFYYDFELPRALTDKELVDIEKRMKKIIKLGLPFEQVFLSQDEARAQLAAQPYKLELLAEILDERVSFFKNADKFMDLCRGPHAASTGAIGAFKILHTAGAYWRGDEKNKMLTRIYGTAWETQEELDAYLARVEDAKRRDHKKLGKDLDLFFFDAEVGKGLPMWTPKGTAIKFELEKFTRELERHYGYEHVETPYLAQETLYKTSGHLAHYRANMYKPIDMDGDEFYLRPMACPHHIKMFMRKPVSYKQMPVRFAEIADYNRFEKSGELMGMIRVRKFTLTDGHLFVTPDGLKDEFKRVCQMIQEGIRGLGIEEKVSYRFSKHDPADQEKYYPDAELWRKSETTMKEALDELGLKYVEATGEAAFYGPKLDVQFRNVNGKEDTAFTAQMDFLLPEKFDISYIGADGSKMRPVMIHRSTIGALERTFAFLIEHYAGAFPLWMSPFHVAVLPVSDAFTPFAREFAAEMDALGIRAQVADETESVGKKIRAAEMEKFPYIIVVGEKEVAGGDLMVRVRGQKDQRSMTRAAFLEMVVERLKVRGLEL